MREAEALLAVVNGCPPDGEVMAELGMAIAWKKPVFLFRGDFRRWAWSRSCPLDPMVSTGFPHTRRESARYTSIDEPRDPEMVLAPWLAGTQVAGPLHPGRRDRAGGPEGYGRVEAAHVRRQRTVRLAGASYLSVHRRLLRSSRAPYTEGNQDGQTISHGNQIRNCNRSFPAPSTGRRTPPRFSGTPRRSEP